MSGLVWFEDVLCLILISVSPELCSERDYVITRSARSMYVVIFVKVLQN